MAKKHLMVSLALSPGVNVLNDLAIVLYRRGEFDRSKEILQKALAKHPSSGILWVNAGNMHVLNNEWPMALGSFDKAAKIDSGNSYAGNMLNFIRNEERDQAVQRATQNLLIAPNNIALPMSRFVLGPLSSS